MAPGVALSGQARPAPEEPLRGIVLSVSATMLFAVADTIAKLLSTQLPTVEIAWIRYVIFFGFAAGLTWRASFRDKTRLFAVRSRTLQVARGLFLVGSSILFILGVRQMPIAQATSISFVSPLLITLLSIPMLGEVVGVRRWAAVAVGMIGVLVVVRPGTGSFQPAAVFAVGSAFCWAMALVITRKMATTERPATTLLWSAGTGVIVLSCLLPFDHAWPTPRQFGLALVLGCVASAGQWMVVLAHRQAPASVLAPFSYVQLLWAILAGYLVFSALPDRWTLLGAGIIVASGLYTAHRERVRGAARRLR
jgi:drug/metabolite transporter (DMT)-like permease